MEIQQLNVFCLTDTIATWKMVCDYTITTYMYVYMYYSPPHPTPQVVVVSTWVQDEYTISWQTNYITQTRTPASNTCTYTALHVCVRINTRVHNKPQTMAATSVNNTLFNNNNNNNDKKNDFQCLVKAIQWICSLSTPTRMLDTCLFRPVHGKNWINKAPSGFHSHITQEIKAVLKWCG